MSTPHLRATKNSPDSRVGTTNGLFKIELTKLCGFPVPRECPPLIVIRVPVCKYFVTLNQDGRYVFLPAVILAISNADEQILAMNL